MTATEINISRDYDNDILYVLKNLVPPKATTNELVSENITVRYILETREIVGFTIDEFSVVCPEWKNQNEYELMEEFDEILEVVNDNCKRKLTAAATSTYL